MVKFCHSNEPSSKLTKLGHTKEQPRAADDMSDTTLRNLPSTHDFHMHIVAIDNSLAFPHHHPKGWRKYSYG